MLMIRLSRVGKKKYATYKIVIQEKSKDPWDKALEYLGNYNPHTKELKVKKERIEYWLSVGAKISAAVNNLLIKNKIIKGEKMKATKLNKKKTGEEKKGEAVSTVKQAKAKEEQNSKKEESTGTDNTPAREEKPREKNKDEEKPAE